MARSRLRRGSPFIPTPHTVEVFREGELEEDRFGNLRPGPGEWWSIKVASWWVHRTEEQSEDSVLRTVDLLTMHTPIGQEPGPSSKVRLPDGSVWEVQGNPEDYNHGPFGFVPGLMVVNCKRTEG